MNCPGLILPKTVASFLRVNSLKHYSRCFRGLQNKQYQLPFLRIRACKSNKYSGKCGKCFNKSIHIMLRGVMESNFDISNLQRHPEMGSILRQRDR